jgi:hypothetical protein
MIKLGSNSKNNEVQYNKAVWRIFAPNGSWLLGFGFFIRA